MRSLLSAFLILLLLHVMAAIGFVGWLSASDRLNRERVEQVVSMFTPTVAEEAKRREEADQAEAKAAEARDQLMRLEAVASGPMTLEDRLMKNFEADEIDLHRLERLHAETDAIRTRLEQDKAIIDQQLAELQAKQEAFDEMVANRTAEMQDEDFKRAVSTLEQLPPKQAKGVIQQYVADGKLEEAVDYLASMQLRKSAGILKAFKDQAEVPEVTQLIEQLRTRGIDPFGTGDSTDQEASL